MIGWNGWRVKLAGNGEYRGGCGHPSRGGDKRGSGPSTTRASGFVASQRQAVYIFQLAQYVMMTSMLRLRSILVTLALVVLATGPASAQDDGYQPSESEPSQSYWGITLQGGMLVPLGGMTDIYQRSLAAGGRLGWTNRHGLGLDVSAEYAPLSRVPNLTGDTYETHYVTASLMPRFTLGKSYLRLWLAAGGGMAYEQSTHIAPAGTISLGTSREMALAGTGAAGLELHPFSGVGLAVISSYTRTYGDIEYQFVNLTGGLVLTF